MRSASSSRSRASRYRCTRVTDQAMNGPRACFAGARLDQRITCTGFIARTQFRQSRQSGDCHLIDGARSPSSASSVVVSKTPRSTTPTRANHRAATSSRDFPLGSFQSSQDFLPSTTTGLRLVELTSLTPFDGALDWLTLTRPPLPARLRHGASSSGGADLRHAGDGL